MEIDDVTPLLLFHGIRVECGLNALKTLKPGPKKSGESSLVTSKAFISTTPILLMGEINPGVTGLPFASIIFADEELRNFPTSTIFSSTIRISPMKLFPSPSLIWPDLIRMELAETFMDKSTIKKLSFFIVRPSHLMD